MEMFEKVQMLKKETGVTYEEARKVLEEAGGDLTEAMILLERRGRKSRAGRGSQDQPARNFGRSLGRMIRALIRFIKRTSFNVTREGRMLFTMPTLVFALLLFFFWEPILPAMLISLFFGVRFHFAGEDAIEKPNRILEKAGDFARNVKDEFTSEKEETAKEASGEAAEEMHMEF